MSSEIMDTSSTFVDILIKAHGMSTSHQPHHPNLTCIQHNYRYRYDFYRCYHDLCLGVLWQHWNAASPILQAYVDIQQSVWTESLVLVSQSAHAADSDSHTDRVHCDPGETGRSVSAAKGPSLEGSPHPRPHRHHLCTSQRECSLSIPNMTVFLESQMLQTSFQTLVDGSQFDDVCSA